MDSLQNFYPILYDQHTGHGQTIQFLKGIREFWASNKDFWFSHKPIDDWEVCEEPWKDTLDQRIRLLLHYDQIFRHPNPNITEKKKTCAFRFATQIALKILHTENQFEECSESEKVFVLLACRHNKSLGLKELALKRALALAEREPTPLTLRFLNATIWDIHCFKQDTYGYKQESPLSVFSPTTNGILQPPCLDPVNIQSLHKKIQNLFAYLFDRLECKRIAVSISGGVDSMVAAKIAKEVCSQQGKELILLHINYCNRETCEEECDLLRYYASQIGAPLFIRHITEIQRIRSTQLRSLYEEITRKIRFSFYAYFDCPVILGHNLDDCYENVFQNLAKQIHFENLFGMRAQSEELGVTVLRPMLSLPKSEIYAYADHTGIPHLYDSTPAWSRRGQMRDALIPGIQTFDPNILPGLKTFVEHTIFLEEQWRHSFDEYLRNSCVNLDQKIILQKNQFFQTNSGSLNFWITLWHSLHISAHRPSNKSFSNFIQQLQTRAKICGLNSEWKAEIHSTEIILRRSAATTAHYLKRG